MSVVPSQASLWIDRKTCKRVSLLGMQQQPPKRKRGRPPKVRRLTSTGSGRAAGSPLNPARKQASAAVSAKAGSAATAAAAAAADEEDRHSDDDMAAAAAMESLRDLPASPEDDTSDHPSTMAGEQWGARAF